MRRWWGLGALIVVVLAGAALFLLRPVTGPTRELTLAADATHGAYVIRLGGCIACHTDAKAGGPELAGGAALPTAFGTFYPPNITPDPETGIGTWTLPMFAKAMSDGEGPKGHLYPAFPYDSYTLMNDQDLVDLFAALQARPPVQQASRPHQLAFPFNIRLALAAWKTLFFHPRRFVADAARSDTWNRGAYLANGPGHCVACHSPRNLLGAIDAGKEYQGNPQGGPGGKTPPLTAAKLVGYGYDRPLLAQTLVDGFTPAGDVIGGAMAEVIEDGTTHWTAEDRAAVAAFLLGKD